MKLKEQVIFDIGSKKFQYLRGVENQKIKRINITDLNARLNKTKKSNIYYNAKIITFTISCLAFVVLISLKF